MSSFLVNSWVAAYDLPTADPFGLSVMVYLSVASVEFTVMESTEAALPPSGQLPSLQDGPYYVSGTSKIFGHLKRKGYDLDTELSNKEKAECAAYTALIEDKLYDALVHTRFSDHQNYLSSTQTHLSRAAPFPDRYWIPQQLRSAGVERTTRFKKSAWVPHTDLWTSSPASERDLQERRTDGENEVFVHARNCYQALSAKLGTHPYIFGKRPSSLDAVLLGHILHHLADPAPHLTNTTLRIILTTEFPSLVAYAERLKTRFIPEGFNEHHLLRFKGKPSSTSSYLSLHHLSSWYSSLPPVTSLPSLLRSASKHLTRLRNDNQLHALLWKWASVAGAVGAFVGYVVYHGIIEIRMEEDEEEEESEEERIARLRKMVAGITEGVMFGQDMGERGVGEDQRGAGGGGDDHGDTDENGDEDGAEGDGYDEAE
ncbi:hypothetical protein M427DRAFT_154105 [Gonapodya prolifera JEL478]|uniref:Mitochondrial outer membrane transport complex Sam37/metaxin N-terminal domain-containing protein n=1 Tax=Gonapodya prolifera (strain JEL478) TaxID=1344416 RepID=A0A139AJT1_GONPJ|nr:hypothetical protein M427DRAFT_154105 [Gonapodya prolifera JEL478]|eukprot:KXS16968.1 hypothetical protein M427DRAFT_154105 [Gonapodya prolifera JEL478]